MRAGVLDHHKRFFLLFLPGDVDGVGELEGLWMRLVNEREHIHYTECEHRMGVGAFCVGCISLVPQIFLSFRRTVMFESGLVLLLLEVHGVGMVVVVVDVVDVMSANMYFQHVID